MATLEDKILGEKLHNYCSSSEDEGDSDSDSDKPPKPPSEPPPSLPEPNKWEGTSTNTGPKGVIKDWQRYKQLENEKREDNIKEQTELLKKLAMTVRSAQDEEQDAILMADEEFLKEYRKKRMEEMLTRVDHGKNFGSIIYLERGEDFLEAIEAEHANVTIIIHIYENNVPACRAMDTALERLSRTYNNFKFCAIMSSRAGMSRDFKLKGVPALLVYKAKQLVGNYVKLIDEFGVDFDAEDVQNYLIENGVLEDKTLMPLIIRSEGDIDSD